MHFTSQNNYEVRSTGWNVTEFVNFRSICLNQKKKENASIFTDD